MKTLDTTLQVTGLVVFGVILSFAVYFVLVVPHDIMQRYGYVFSFAV
jgi:hypothetical protein